MLQNVYYLLCYDHFMSIVVNRRRGRINKTTDTCQELNIYI